MRSILTFCVTWLFLVLAACQSLNPAQSLSPMPSPTELPSGGDGWTEITSGVVQHAGGGGGRLFVFGNGNGSSWPLQNSTVAASDALVPMATHLGRWGSDQQTVQLANGDLLLSWNGYSQLDDAEFKKSEWWSKWPVDGQELDDLLKNYPGVTATPNADAPTKQNRNGVRPAEVLQRYSANEDKWIAQTALDSALVGGSKADGTIARSLCAQSVPFDKGFDRPELYADPWGVDNANPSKQRLFVAVRCRRNDDGDDSEQLFTSNDSGAIWNDSGVRLPGAMTSVTATPSGRVFLLQAVGNAMEMYYSDDHGKTVGTGFDIATPGLPPSALEGEIAGVGMPWMAPTPIAAVGPSAVLAVYPSVENVAVNRQAIQRQVAVVVLVSVPLTQDPKPVIAPVIIIRAAAADGSVILPSLITDTRAVDNPTSMLYWLETTGIPKTPGVDPTTLVARYAMFGGAGNFPGPTQLLSGSTGFQTTTVQHYGFGDYMRGTFYYDDELKTRNFVAVWPQQKADGKVKPFARIITFAD